MAQIKEAVIEYRDSKIPFDVNSNSSRALQWLTLTRVYKQS